MKMNRKAGICVFILMFMIGCVSCAKKNAADNTAENVPNALDVILGESDDDLLVMGESDGAGETILPIEGEGAEIIPGPIVIYYNSQDFSHLMCEEVEVGSITPAGILTALAAHNIVTIDTKHNSFGIQETEDGRKCLFLDLNKKFGEYMGTMAQSGEEIILAALTDTFLENYGADMMYLSVEGEHLKTYHNTYREPFVWSDYEVEKEK